MTPENISPIEKQNFWQRLTAPHPAIEDFAERRFASVLATLLLALLPLYFLPEGIRAILEKHSSGNIAYFGTGVIVLGVAYFFARSPRPRWGAALTMFYFTIIPFAALILQSERYSGDNARDALIWSVPIMLMALILLHPKDVKWVVLFQIALYLIIPAVWDGLSFAQVFSTLWIVMAVGGLMIISAFVQSRYLHRAAYEAQQNKIAERRFRNLFLSSPISLLEADFSQIKARLDKLAAEHGNDLKSYILQHPESMQGAGSSVRLLDANLRALELYEASDTETLLSSLRLAVTPREMFALRDGVIALWEGESNFPIETTHQTLNKKQKNVLVRFSVRSGYEDSWKSINISVSDVTARRAAEASARLLASAVEASASSVVMTDMDGNIEYVNPAFSKNTGYSVEEALGQNPRILKSDQHSAEFYAEMWQTLLNGNAWQGELVNKKKNGELYWETVTISPVRDDAGEVRHYVAVKDDITLFKQAEERIRQQGEFLQTVMDGIDNPFYVLNVADFSIEMANKAARKMGLAEAKTCYALTHHLDVPCSGDDHPCPIKHVLQYKEPFVVEHVHYGNDGLPYDVEVHGYPIYDLNGDVVQMIEYSLDISARKEAERELRKLSNAAEQAASGIVITDVNSVIEFANPAAARITGYEIDELIGKTTNILKSGKHDAEFYNNLWDTLQRGETWRGELINRRKDGMLYWESQVISSVRNNAGEVTHYVAVKEDVTQQKESAKQLRNLSSATEQTASGIVISDAEGRVEYINPAFTNNTGYTLEDLRGKTLEMQRSGQHPQFFYDYLEATMQHGEVWKGEIVNLRKDGSAYWEALTVSPIKNEEGLITHRVYVKEDISQRKELEQALALAHDEALVASDMKTQLLANVSHDMRTPLGAILGYTEMLQTGVFEPLNEEQDNAMRSISASAQRLLDFVSNLLSQAQIDTGKVVLNKSLFKPEKLITTMGGELSFARSKGLGVQTEVDENLPELIEGDSYWLGQILHNLVSNAIKFTPADGKISIKFYRYDEAHWAVCVADTGKGIPADAKEYIFESFRQVDGSTHREAHTGSGLGLSIVNHLVRLMDGEIHLESELGQGSTFTVVLPLNEVMEN